MHHLTRIFPIFLPAVDTMVLYSEYIPDNSYTISERRDEDSDEEEGLAAVGDDIALPDGKVGKKKLAKLQAKAERRANREVSFYKCLFNHIC